MLIFLHKKVGAFFEKRSDLFCAWLDYKKSIGFAGDFQCLERSESVTLGL
jgi:hypothetical protein